MTDTATRILLSRPTEASLGAGIGAVFAARPFRLLTIESLEGQAAADFDIAFVTRDVTGLSTKHVVLEPTRRFYEAMRGAASLRWVQMHSAGADRPIYGELRARGVTLTSGSGVNAAIVAQTAIASVLALTRRLPQLMAAQKSRTWAPLIAKDLPRDLMGQTAMVIGWGPIGRELGRLLAVLGLEVIVVRNRADAAGDGIETATFDSFRAALPRTDWLLLACPLTEKTRGLIDRAALAALKPGACLVNVARGDVIVEAELVEALRSGHVGGAYLDVFQHEPLDTSSPLWDLENVILTPHCSGQSSGNRRRLEELFLRNLASWLERRALVNEVR